MTSQGQSSERCSQQDPKAFPGPVLRWQSLARPAVAGFAFGYLVLHPVSMVVFQWLDPRIAAVSHERAGVLSGPILHSFHLDMLPMGLVFGVIGLLITTFHACYREAIAAQRDRLAEELTRNERLRNQLADQAVMLEKSNKKLAGLELANRRTTQFMAHDFKTALGCDSGFAGQLLEQPRLREDHDVAEALVCIRRQAHRVMGSVMDFLEFARLRERLGPRMKSISVGELLQEAVNDFSLPVHSKHITRGDHYASCPPLSADPRLLRRVLCNLISNAVKHNGPDTHVRLDGRVDDARTEVLFSCCDDGAGIPPELLPTIFAEFAGTADASGDSTGLGLAFCKAVVESHGGRIWCESTHRRGARFFFTIPLHKEPNNDQ